MRQIATLFVMIAFAAAGCASDDGPSVLTLGRPAAKSLGALTVTVDPYLERERQDAFFSEDFTEHGLVPARVTVRNDGSQPLEVRASEIVLVTADGAVLTPENGETMVTILRSNPNAAGSVAAGVMVGVILGGPAAAQSIMAQREEAERIRKARIADYNEKRLKDGTIGPGESVAGFLYFSAPNRDTALDDAAMELRVGGAGKAPPALLVFPFAAAAASGNQAGPAPTAPRAAAEPPRRTIGETRVYLLNRREGLRGRLKAYNAKHRLLVTQQGPNSDVKDISKLELVAAYGDTLWVEIAYTVGDRSDTRFGSYLFRLAWRAGRLEFVEHRSTSTPPEEPPPFVAAEPAPSAIVSLSGAAGNQPAASAVPVPEAAADPALYAEWQVRGYLRHHERRFRSKLADYNKKHRLVVDPQGRSEAVSNILTSEVRGRSGNKVVLEVAFQVGRGSDNQYGTYVFDLEWRNDHLELIDHRTVAAWREENPQVEEAAPKPAVAVIAKADDSDEPKVAAAPAARTKPNPASDTDPPVHNESEVRAYLSGNQEKLRLELSAYNKKHRLLADAIGSRYSINSFDTQIKELKGRAVVLEITYDVGRGTNTLYGTYVFDFEWQDGHLQILSHRPI